MNSPRFPLLALTFLGALAFLPACSEDVPLGNGNQQNNLDKTSPSNKDKVCAQALTCVEGQMYPTACGPSNGDKPLGPCEEPEPTCDPELICAQVMTCVDGQLYPTGCGPKNCDKPLGPC
ncbi:MAG: hypothetical protein RMJ98_11375 [Myxococcales bacterium]|nr:hypothetical protein [Myxococcales bacterium]